LEEYMIIDKITLLKITISRDINIHIAAWISINLRFIWVMFK